MQVRITVGPSNYNVKYGTMVNLTCTVEGFPKPNIVWLKRGRPIPSSIDKPYLVINATMSANYTCSAYNNPKNFPEKQVEKTGQVLVKGVYHGNLFK